MWTTAPEAYDSGGTETVKTGGDFHGKTLRRVLIEPRSFEYQTMRYGSGLHGSWGEDPRAHEARIRETAERERAQREEDAARRAAGLAWLTTAPHTAVEDADENWDAWQARGLTTEDARAERKRRKAEEDASVKAAEWARCAALIPEGSALIDEGTKGFRSSYGGWITGQPADAWASVRIVTGWPPNDPEVASLVGEGDVAIGSLTVVAQRITEGRVRVATPEEASRIPPPPILKRLGHREWKAVHRVEVEGRTVWVGRAHFGECMVLDADGKLVRAKKVREAAIRSV